jgi:hypothetical protein
MFRVVVPWIIIIILVIWAMSNPTAAGHDVHTWFTSIVTFFSSASK